MRSFLKGWWRKVGLTTLTLAVLLAAGWGRSFYSEDFVSIQYRRLDTFVFSSGGFLLWQRTIDRDHNQGERPVSHASMPYDSATRYDPWKGLDVDWRMEFAGASIGAGTHQAGPGTLYHFRMWVIPYWMLVLPLTLTSACLILSKPRKKTPIAVGTATDQ